MGGSLPFLLCGLGVAGLFYLHREKSIRNSKALWLPIIWIALAGSRGVSGWLTGSDQTTRSTLEGGLDGSPIDAAAFGMLLAIGVIVLYGRGKRTRAYLAVTGTIIVYFAYSLISSIWAPYSLPALKRGIKDVGDFVMALIIVTDPQPLAALRRFYTRVGILLFPLSIVLIRYSTLGRSWDADGILMTIGVSTHKNSLGLIVFVMSLGVVWNFRWLLMNRNEPNRRRRLAAEGIILAFGIILLSIAHSSTSLTCFLLGSGILFLTHLRTIRSPTRVHLLSALIFLFGGGFMLFGGMGDVAGALGRGADLSGRTFMWAAMFPAVSNPLIGAGFDSFWTSPNADVFHHSLSLLHWYHPERINEAHDGYIEVYLDLGWIGVCLMASILATGYWRACKTFRRDPELASAMLAYIITGAIYSITEAGFRTLNPIWICILLALVSVSGASKGLFWREACQVRSSVGRRPPRPRGLAATKA
jgi:exopolysaccharide production protein ExoQ